MKKVLSVLLTIFLCFNLIAPGTVSAATIKISKSKLELRAGDTYTLKLSGATGTIKWSSSKKSVATVSSKGKVTAVKAGKSSITATFKEKIYKCALTVKSSETVDVVYTAYTDLSIEEFVEKVKNENPDYLDVKPYDDGHITVTMYESDRVAIVNDINDKFDNYLQSIISSYDGVFTNIESDKLFKNITIYADKDKYEESSAELGILLAFGLVAEGVQAINLVDVTDRTCNLTIIDNATGDILYPIE